MITVGAKLDFDRVFLIVGVRCSCCRPSYAKAAATSQTAAVGNNLVNSSSSALMLSLQYGYGTTGHLGRGVEEDSDVQAERNRVMSDLKVPASANVIVKEMTKYYHNFCAVDRLSFEVGSECFGLLGCNGAGKTSI